MSVLVIPNDRSTKQRVRCICRNPECLESSDKPHFEFTSENAHIVCPKCGADRSPVVAMLALVHFLHRDRAGPVVGVGGLRYRFACDQTRAYLATETNQEAATGDFAHVNCPGCLKAAIDKKLVPLTGFAMNVGQFEERV